MTAQPPSNRPGLDAPDGVSSRPQDSSAKPVQRRLLIPLATVLLLLVTGFGFALFKSQQRNVNQISLQVLGNIADELAVSLVEQADAMDALEETLLRDVGLIDALKAQDRDRLLADCEPIFTHLRDGHGITHFYFHGPDRVNLLRVHSPKKHGDLINRFTAREAERTGRTSSGIEMGPLGTFTLRVVRPVFDGETLVGYLELGKEIEDVLATVHNKDEIELAVAISKTALKREKWEGGMKMLGRDGDWDRFAEDVLIYTSMPSFPSECDHFVAEEGHLDHAVTVEVGFNGKKWQVLVTPLVDVSGTDVGDLIVFYDTSEAVARFNQMLAVASGAVLAILAAMIGFLYFALRRVDRDILTREAKQGEFLHDVEERVKELHCLHCVAETIRKHDSFGGIFQQVALLLPPGWLFPEIARGLVRFDGQDYVSEPFERTQWTLTSDIIVGGQRRGFVEVCYLEQRPDQDEGPFLKEERALIDSIAHALSEAAEHKQAEAAAATYTVELEEQTAELEKSRRAAMGMMEDAEQARRAAEQAREALAKSDQAFMDSFYASADATLLIDGEAFVDCNERAVQMLRAANKEQVLATHPSELSPGTQPDGRLSFEKANDMIAIAFERGSNRFEWNLCHMDGEVFPVEVTLMPVSLFGKQRLYCMWKDISELVRVRAAAEQAEEELRENNAMMVDALEREKHAAAKLEATVEQLEVAKQDAEAASRSKSEFLANMSHEIRTPMTAILGYSDTLLEEGDISSAPPDRVAAIQTIRRNGEHLLQLINDILDISKIEAGKLDIECIGCSPVQVVADVRSLMQVRADAKNLPFNVEFIGAVPETIQSDPTRLKQILVNLIGNAIKFTETGGVRLVTRFVDTDPIGGTGPAEPMMQFDVVDTGIGLTEEHAGKLFQAFSQADASTTRKFGGTGLGLNISKRLSEMLGGDIVIESKIGEGSTFRVMVTTGSLEGVKMLDDPGTATIVKPEVPGRANSATEKLDCRILLAEDGPDNQRLISHMLKKAGAEMTVKENGKLAFEAALAAREEGNPFDVILMDMQMPVMDGYEATGQLRQQGYTGPIIALTAHAMASDRQKCIDAGCDDYGTKPIDRKKLIETIRKYLPDTASAKLEHFNVGQA